MGKETVKILALLLAILPGRGVSADSNLLPDEIPGLTAFDLLELNVPSTPGQPHRINQRPETSEAELELEAGQPVIIPIRIDGQERLLTLEPYSVRSAGFQLWVQGEDGQVNRVPSPPVTTYRGSVDADPNSLVLASLNEGRLNASIVLSDQHAWQVQPLSDLLPGTVSTETHVLYREEDATAPPGQCGTESDYVISPLSGSQAATANAVATSGLPKLAEIAVDADYEYFQINGSSVTNTVNDIETIMNAVSSIYLRDTGVRHTISQIIVRSSVNDPYGGALASLDEFTNYWNSVHGNVPRDAAHLFTGKGLGGNTIGVAWVATFCSLAWSYGVSQVHYTGSFPHRVALVCHELGHNWSAGHCNGDADCSIMCSGLGGCTGVVESFGASAIGSITSWRDGAGCLSTLTTALHWPFDENTGTTVQDFSDFDYTGTLRNMTDTAWVGGRTGGALLFDGVNDYVEIVGYRGISGNQPRTVSAWIKTTTAGEIVTWGQAAAGEKWILRVQDDGATPGTIRLEVGGGYVAGATDIMDGLWHHVAAVLEQGFSDILHVKLYVDGRLETIADSSGPQPINTASNADVKIGVFIGVNHNRYFNGMIDEPRIWNFALNSVQIGQAMFGIPLSGTEDSHWAFDEGSGSVAGDRFGNDRTGTLTQMDPNSWTAGLAGMALEFDGIDDFVQITGYTGVSGNQPRTVAAWIRTTTTGEIVTWGRPAPGEKWVFRVQDDDGVAGAIRAEVGGGYVVGSTDVRDGLWHHVAAVLGQGANYVEDVALYVDGRRETITASNGPQWVNTASDADVKIGIFIGSNRYFSGMIDDVRIYSYGLTEQDVSNLAYMLGIQRLRYGFDDYYTGLVSPDAMEGPNASPRNMDQAAQVDGIIGDALQFDGVDDYLEIVGYKGITGSSPRTVTAWIKTTTTGEIVTWGNPAQGEKWVFRVQDDHGAAGAIRAEVGAGYVVGATDVRDDAWHHVAAVLEPGLSDIQEVKLYVDGLLETQSAFAGPQPINTTGATSVKIGIFLGSDRYFTGLVDDVRIYDVGLDSNQIRQAMFNVPLTSSEDSHWRFNEASGLVTANAVASDRTGALTGMESQSWVEGVSGSALQFDGVDDYVEITDYQGISGVAPRSVSAWLKTSAAGEIISWGSAAPGLKWLFRVEEAGALRLEVGAGAIVGSTDLRDGNWHHVAAVSENDGTPNIDEIKLYVDGIEEDYMSVLNQVIDTAVNANVKIGAFHPVPRYFEGLLDEVRIFSYALTEADVAASARWPGDLDGSRFVDLTDLAFFTRHWLDVECNKPDCHTSDFDDNGSIDLLDFFAWVEQWLDPPAP
jgi:hypothetical protein